MLKSKRMVIERNRTAVEAILLEYKSVVVALQKVIQNMSYANLTTIVDSNASDSNCQSIQTILTHVVSSGFSYGGYIRKLKNIPDNRLGKMLKMSAQEYYDDLEAMVLYINQTFENIFDDELEEFDEAKKIKTSWGQVYDIEQMMEHSVLQVLVYRRQIEKYLQRLEVL